MIRRCGACEAREKGQCDWCLRRARAASLVWQLGNNAMFNRYFWLGAIAHVLTCRLRVHGECSIEGDWAEPTPTEGK